MTAIALFAAFAGHVINGDGIAPEFRPTGPVARVGAYSDMDFRLQRDDELPIGS